MLQPRRDFLRHALLAAAGATAGLRPARARARRPDEGRCAAEPEPVRTGHTTPADLGEAVAGIYFPDVTAGVLAWTFDDGPRAGSTPAILDQLDRLGLTAAFFVCGRSVHRAPGVLRDIVARGHDVGNHTWSHPALHTLSDDELDGQLRRTQEAVDEALGRHLPLRFHRPPFGAPWYGGVRDRALQIRRVCRAIDRQRGLLALWQMELGDWRRGATEEDVLRRLRMCAARGKGGALVMHDTRQVTIRVLSDVARVARQRGYQPTSLDALVVAKYGAGPEHVADLPTSLRPARAAASGEPPEGPVAAGTGGLR